MNANYIRHIKKDVGKVLNTPLSSTMYKHLLHVIRLCNYYTMSKDNAVIKNEIIKMNNISILIETLHVYINSLNAFTNHHLIVDKRFSSGIIKSKSAQTLRVSINKRTPNLRSLLQAIEDTRKQIEAENVNFQLLMTFIENSAIEAGDIKLKKTDK